MPRLQRPSTGLPKKPWQIVEAMFYRADAIPDNIIIINYNYN